MNLPFEDMAASEKPMESSSPRIGVFVCHCGTNIAGVVNVKEVAQAAATYQDVVFARDYQFMCSEGGQELIKKTITSKKLDKVIVASCSPKLHEETFRRVLLDVGMNEFNFEMVNLREHDSWTHPDQPAEATLKAKGLILAAVNRARYLEPVGFKEFPVEKHVLVIGGGISGINAAIDLGNMGIAVTLVERKTSIGGNMIRLDKTFPTMDCSSCILMPKMSEVANHKSVRIIAPAEVERVDKVGGNFKVTINKKTRYVDTTKCISCGVCEKNCPVTVPSEHNEQLGTRKAAYRLFPQAIPSKFTINSKDCLWFKDQSCTKCRDKCPTKAIDFSLKDEKEELTVGAAILATGFDLYDLTKIKYFGYGVFPNVLNSMQMERMVDHSGPTHGEIKRPSDGATPRSITWIQCVGSRSEEHNPDCCRIGCTATIKEANLVLRELSHHQDLKLIVCGDQIRTIGKGHESFFRYIREQGVLFVKGRPNELRENPDHSLSFNVWDSSIGRMLHITSDMVVLQGALGPSIGANELGHLFGVDRGLQGFFKEAHPKLEPLKSKTRGVYMCGVAQGPKDITDSVSQAKGAAAEAAQRVLAGKTRVFLNIAECNKTLCIKCKMCERACPFKAISVDETGANIREIDCRSCGICAGVCPTGAMSLRHYRDTQIIGAIKGLLKQDEHARPDEIAVVSHQE